MTHVINARRAACSLHLDLTVYVLSVPSAEGRSPFNGCSERARHRFARVIVCVYKRNLAAICRREVETEGEVRCGSDKYEPAYAYGECLTSCAS